MIEPRVIEPTELRRQLTRWTTGVTVITTMGADGVPLGKAANSFHSVSLDPPLVAWCVDVRSTRYDEWIAAPGFVVHILADDQTDLVYRFARRGGDKFADLAWQPGPWEMPQLEASLRLTCRTWKQFEAGDHTYLIGEVIDVAERDHSGVLLFHGGRPTTLAELNAPSAGRP